MTRPRPGAGGGFRLLIVAGLVILAGRSPLPACAAPIPSNPDTGPAPHGELLHIPQVLWTAPGMPPDSPGPQPAGPLILVTNLQRLVALDRITGKELWRFEGGGTLQQPRWTAGWIVVGTEEGPCRLLDPATGRTAAAANLNSALGSVEGTHADLAFVPIPNRGWRLRVILPPRGAARWRWEVEDAGEADPTARRWSQAWRSLRIAVRLPYHGFGPGWLWATDRRTGALRWRTAISSQDTAALLDGALTIEVRAHLVYLHRYRLEISVDQASWWNSGRPARPGSAIAPTDLLMAYDAATGAPRWTLEGAGQFRWTEGANLVYLVRDQYLQGIDLHTGIRRWEIPNRVNPLCRPVASGGRVYFYSSQEIYCADALKGRLLSRYDVTDQGGIAGAAAVDGNTAYLVTGKGDALAVEFP